MRERLTLRNGARLLGVLALLSVLTYGFTGVTWWVELSASIEGFHLRFTRGAILLAVHVFCLFVGAMSFDDNIWRKDD